MENQKVKTILKSVVIIAILFVLVFGLRAQAADIGGVPNEIKANYMDADGLPYFSEMDSYYNLRLTENYMYFPVISVDLRMFTIVQLSLLFQTTNIVTKLLIDKPMATNFAGSD